MKRVLSLVLALVLVLGMIPTFAAEKTGGEELKALGLLSGNENGDLMEDQTLERQEFAKIIAQLNGALDEAAAYVTPGTFADFDKVEGWAKPYVAYAEEQGWMTGKDGNMFDPAAELKSQELLTVLLRVLGYDDTWSKVFETAAEVGLVAEEISAITRGDAFELIWTAVSEVVMADSDMTLGVHLGVLEPAKPVVTDLTVESVSATNLREVIVEFNNEIDADTLDKANFTIGGTAATSVALSEDGMTVTAWFEMANQSTYTLKIATVKDVNGSEVKKFEQQFTVNDFTAPVVEKVTVVGNKKLVVTFSEPVTPATASVLGNYKINDLLFGGMVTVDGREVTIVLSSRLVDGVHKLAVNSNVVDYAGFKLVANNNEFAVAKDEVKPAFATLVSASQTKVVVTLSEAVESSFTVSAGVGAFVEKSTKDDTTWTLTFNTATPLPLSGTEITLTDVVDYYGNKETIKFSVVPTIDLVRPEVKAVTVTAQDEITVEFTKEVDLTAGYTLKSVKTTPVTQALNAPAYYVNDDAKVIKTKVVLTSVADLEAGDYTLEVLGVKDLTPLANVMVPYTSVVKVADLTKPLVSSVEIVAPTTAATGILYIKFDEKLDPAAATNKANYSYIVDSVKQVALGENNTVTLLADGMTVKIILSKLATGDTAVTSVTVLNVTDVAGNKIVTKFVKTTDPEWANYAAAAPTITNARATALNKVVVDVTGSINPATVTASDFVIQELGTSTSLIYVINAEYDAELSTITLTLNNNLTKTALYGTKQVEVAVIAQNLSDVFGEKVLVGTDDLVADKIAPAALKVASANAGATTAVIKVNLDEALDAPVLNDTTDAYFVVKLNGVLYVPSAYVVTYGLDGTTPQLTITVTTTADLTGKAFSVEYFKNVALDDAQSNQLASFTFSGTLE